jgi:hypothetical protein
MEHCSNACKHTRDDNPNKQVSVADLKQGTRSKAQRVLDIRVFMFILASYM